MDEKLIFGFWSNLVILSFYTKNFWRLPKLVHSLHENFLEGPKTNTPVTPKKLQGPTTGTPANGFVGIKQGALWEETEDVNHSTGTPAIYHNIKEKCMYVWCMYGVCRLLGNPLRYGHENFYGCQMDQGGCRNILIFFDFKKKIFEISPSQIFEKKIFFKIFFSKNAWNG